MNEIFKRVSNRSFQDRPVSIDLIERIIEAGMQAPTAGNQQPWEFVVINDKETLSTLSKVSVYSTPISKTPLAIVVLSKSDKELSIPVCKIQDLSACSQNMLIEATALDLGSLWIPIEPFEDRKKYVKKLLDIPDNREAFSIICVGYAQKERKQISRFDRNRIHFNKY